jgi:type II secretory pathway component HofQ
MAEPRRLPSPDDTQKVVKQLEDLTSEAQRLSAQLSDLVRAESAPRPNQRKRHPDGPPDAPPGEH